MVDRAQLNFRARKNQRSADLARDLNLDLFASGDGPQIIDTGLATAALADLCST